MNILVVTPYYPSERDTASGLFVHEQVLALRRQGVNVRVLYVYRWVPALLSRRSIRSTNDQRRPPYYEWDGVPVYSLRTPILPRHRLIHISGATARFLFSKRVAPGFSLGDIDLIHGHELFPTGQLAARVATDANLPLILTIHGTDGTGRSYATDARRAAIRHVFQRASTVVFVGSQMVRAYDTLVGIGGTQTAVIPNGIDPHKQRARPKRPPAWTDKFLIVSVSNLTESKGIADNLRALEIVRQGGLQNAHYVAVGDGRHRRRFEELAAELGLFDSVTFTGRVPNDRALDLIAMGDVFSLPSTNEAFGIVYLEAMLLGKPAIGVAGQGPSDVIEDGITGFLVPPGTPGRLARIWQRLADDRDLRSTLGDRARSQILGRFSWDANATATATLYAAAVHGGHSHGK